ncbi:MAG: hypothetical protein CL799_02830 [Chromatiales bacterium]|nr:hypothetical protein [Chromatiales bacterium]
MNPQANDVATVVARLFGPFSKNTLLLKWPARRRGDQVAVRRHQRAAAVINSLRITLKNGD